MQIAYFDIVFLVLTNNASESEIDLFNTLLKNDPTFRTLHSNCLRLFKANFQNKDAPAHFDADKAYRRLKQKLYL